MEKTFKYRIYPNKAQCEQIAKTIGCCRYVYNRALGIRKNAYDAGEVVPSVNECITILPKWKQEKDTKWLAEADSSALQQSLRDLDKAYKNFFREPGHVGFPKFKSKRTSRRSYRTENINGKAIQTLDNKHIKLPKLGSVKARVSRPYEGRIMSATVIRTPDGKYYVCLCCTDCMKISLPKTDKTVGIDLGSRKLVTTSDGDMIQNPKYYRKSKKKLAREQRRLSRKQGARKGETPSNNYKKQRKKVARLHAKVANQRSDYAHKMTTALIDENQVICAESLRVRNMIRNHKLALTIADASWGEICRQLEYKADWYGREFVQIASNYPSSQICHVCGTRNVQVKDLREKWTCEGCGTQHDRDINAAKNILHEGLAKLGWDTPEVNACGECVRPVFTSVDTGNAR